MLAMIGLLGLPGLVLLLIFTPYHEVIYGLGELTLATITIVAVCLLYEYFSPRR